MARASWNALAPHAGVVAGLKSPRNRPINPSSLTARRHVMAKTASKKSNPSVTTTSKKSKPSVKDVLTTMDVNAVVQGEVQKHLATNRAKSLAKIRSKKIRTNNAISKLLNSARDAVNTLSADGWNAIVDFRSDGIHYYRSLGQISTLLSEFMRADMAMGIVDGNAELAPDEKEFEYARLGRERDAVLDQLEMALDHSRMYARAYW